MKLYIAASSHPDERARVDRAFGAAIAIHGVEIVGDWRPSVDEHGRNPGGQPARDAARACLLALDRCDTLWLLLPLTESRGCWVELGYAHGRGSRVIASGEQPPSQSVFTTMIDTYCLTDTAAISELTRVAETRGANP